MNANQIRVKDLLYMETEIINKIHCEIEETLRGHGRKNEDLRESLDYTLDERFSHMREAEKIKG